MASLFRNLGCLSVLLLAGTLALAQQGDVRRVHDPCIIAAGGSYYVFCTGGGIPIRRSKDLIHWERLGSVLTSVPAWASREIPGARSLWAPDISFFNGKYHLYYSVSTFGSNRSCIGLATNATLDPASPAYRWVDQGKVIESTRADNFNAIDANIILDEQKQPWMALGSFWSGIKLFRIDPQTGKAPAGVQAHSLAARARSGAIEAPFLIRRGEFYYLFVSFDICCKRTDSTYKIMVGRSRQITGPYLDREGKAMLEGGGTLVLASQGHVRGPGHNAILEEKGKHWLVHHYYDAGANGIPTLQIRPLTWDETGWPIAGEPVADAIPGAASAGRSAEPSGLHPIYDEPGFYPRGLELADGTLLVTFDHPIPGGRAVACIGSTDGGKTWGDYRRMAEDTGRVDVANAFPVQLADGTVLVAYRHHLPDKRIFRIEVVASGDNGKTWQFRNTIATGTVGLWEPFLFQPSKNVLQVYYASEEGIYPEQRIEMKTSHDGGKTWGTPATVARKPGSRDGMPSIVRAKDGSLLACFEASDTPPFRFVVRMVRSKDDGVTWGTERELVYQPVNPAPQRWAAGAPYLACRGDGRLLVSFQTDEDVLYRKGDAQADPAVEGYRYERHTILKLVTSDDNGGSWTRPATLAGAPDGPATWGGMCMLRNGNVLALTTGRGRIWARAINASAPAR